MHYSVFQDFPIFMHFCCRPQANLIPSIILLGLFICIWSQLLFGMDWQPLPCKEEAISHNLNTQTRGHKPR